MLTEIEMDRLAEKYISEISGRTQIDISLLKEHTKKKQYGNIYFYNSTKYKETREFEDALLGNGPFLIEKEFGKIIVFGTAQSEEYYMKEYEEGRLPNNRK